jgi:hypothetical protein
VFVITVGGVVDVVGVGVIVVGVAGVDGVVVVVVDVIVVIVMFVDGDVLVDTAPGLRHQSSTQTTRKITAVAAARTIPATTNPMPIFCVVDM